MGFQLGYLTMPRGPRGERRPADVIDAAVSGTGPWPLEQRPRHDVGGLRRGSAVDPRNGAFALLDSRCRTIALPACWPAYRVSVPPALDVALWAAYHPGNAAGDRR